MALSRNASSGTSSAGAGATDTEPNGSRAGAETVPEHTPEPMPEPTVTPDDLRPGANLRGEVLIGLDLNGVDLSGADLSQADLRGVRAIGAVFDGAKLHGAQLDRAQLLHTQMTGVDLSEASLAGANVGGSTLDAAVLFGADLTNASLTQASLRNADLRTADLTGARLMSSDLTGADATNADLVDTDLTGATVTEAVFRDADLNEARLNRIFGYGTADWIGTQTTNTDFTGAFLARRFIIDQNYLHEFRAQSRAHEWIYRVWWLTSDCGRSFVRWGLCTLLFALFFAGVYEFVDIDFGDKTPLSSFYFSIVTLTTLGYGDVLPQSQTAQAVVVVQVLIGFGMLGGLLSMFSNKMSRRGE